MTTASTEAFASMLPNDESGIENERFKHQGNITKLEFNNNQLSIEIKKKKHEAVVLKMGSMKLNKT